MKTFDHWMEAIEHSAETGEVAATTARSLNHEMSIAYDIEEEPGITRVKVVVSPEGTSITGRYGDDKFQIRIVTP